MVKTRSQDGDSKGKERDVEDPLESRLSRLEDMLAERSKMMKQLADMVEAFSRSTAGKIEFPRFEDECDDDQTFDGEFGESIEHGMVNLVPEAQEENPKAEIREGLVHKAILEEESMPQFQEMEEFPHQSTNGNGENIAHQVFGKMSRHETLGIKKKTKGFKSWRFKFKHRVASRESKAGFEVNMKHKQSKEMLLQLLHSGTHKKRQRKTPTYPKTWKFRFKNMELQRIMTQLDTQHFIFRLDKQPLLWMQNNSEPILIVSELERKKKLCFKTWMFKYKVDEEDQGILQSRTGWVQEVSDVIRFLLRRHLHLNLDCEEPERAGRKRNHGLFIRLLNKLKQQRCPKSWMFKFKTDSKPARTNHILHQKKKPNEFEQVVKHTPFSVVKLGKPKDHDALLVLLSGDESFQIKHKWRFKLLPLILEWELYSDCLVLTTNYAQQLDISRLMILMSVGWFTNLRSQLLFTTLKWSIQ